MASATPKACVETRENSAGRGWVLSSNRCSVPGLAPVHTASTSTTASVSCHSASNAVPSPAVGTIVTPSRGSSCKRRATTSPTASSPRQALPTPRTSTRGGRCAGEAGAVMLPPVPYAGAENARVVVTNRLLALPGELLLRQRQGLRYEVGQIQLDPLLVLRRWRHDLGVENGAGVVEIIAVIQNAAWCLSTAIAR